MNNRIFCALGVSLLVTGFFSGCGSGREPISVIGLERAQTLPVNTMSLPLSVAAILSQPFSSSNTGFTLTSGTVAFGTTTAVKAPAAGLITLMDTGTQSVTIMAHPRVMVQVQGITASLQAGTYVTQDQQLGVVSNSVTGSVTPTVKLIVLLDGVAICPLSFLSSAARNQLITTFNYSLNPCQP